MININGFNPKDIKVDKNYIKIFSSYWVRNYDNKNIKIGFDLDDNLSLKKELKMHDVVIIIKSVFFLR